MSATMTSQKTAKSGCGCGSSGTKKSAPCNCGCGGSTDCVTCQDHGYIRPLFFAGQLLTEDDLQQLTDYVVAKNRLHARYLSGSGVVCGLEVVCEPCDGAKVVVNPGYALDCCGNDIVLSCPQTLDINKMVRELKAKLRGGYDCQDPCAGVNTKTPSAGTGSVATPVGRVNPFKQGGTSEEPNPAHKYCLYVSYCEKPTDPVSPYATDAPCGPTTSCYPTRCLEAFRFELRCPPPCEEDSTLCSRLWACLGDRTAYERVSKLSQSLAVYGQTIVQAAEKLRETPIPPLDAAYSKRVREETAKLQNLFKIVAEKKKLDASDSRSFLDAVLPLASDVARFRIQTKKVEGADHEDALKAEGVLRQALSIYREHSDAIHQTGSTAAERAHTTALFETVEKMVPQEGEAGAKVPRVAKVAAPLTDPSIKYLAAGAVFDSTFQSAAHSDLSALRDWLIDHLERAPQTDCGLLSKVLAVTLPSTASTAAGAFVDANMTGTAAETLGSAAQQVLRSCICNALNPPCASCEDNGVLLACLTVENCKVTEICNAVRQFVLTPVNLRYWFPEINRIGKEIAEWCCQCECPEDEKTGMIRNESEFGAFTRVPTSVRLMQALLRAQCPEPDKSRVPIYRDRFTELLESGPISKTVVCGGISLEDSKKIVREAVQTATANLEQTLSDARDELDSLRQEHKRLFDRVGRLEKKPAKGQPEA